MFLKLKPLEIKKTDSGNYCVKVFIDVIVTVKHILQY